MGNMEKERERRDAADHVLRDYKVRSKMTRIEAIRYRTGRYLKHRKSIKDILEQHGYSLVMSKVVDKDGWVRGYEQEWKQVIKSKNRRKEAQLSLW